MQAQSDANENSAPGLNATARWSVVAVTAMGGYRIRVQFADGITGEADLSRLIFSDDAGVFQHLRDPLVFAEPYVEHGAVTWPGGVDLAPEAMHHAIVAEGLWIP